MQGNWVDVDQSGEWGAHKLRLRERLGDRVYCVRPEAQQAALELAELVSHETRVMGSRRAMKLCGRHRWALRTIWWSCCPMIWSLPIGCSLFVQSKRLAARGKTRPHNGGGP